MPPVLSPSRSSTSVFDDAVARLRRAALARALDEPDPAGRILLGRLAPRPAVVDRAIDAVVAEAAHHLLVHGWTPGEVHAFAARRLDAAALGYLLDALAGTSRWTVAAPWRAELDRLPARVWWTTGRPHVTQWADRHGRGRAETLRVVVDVLAILGHLPRTDHPCPGMPSRLDGPHEAGPVDARTARRIDALLTRAAATDYPAEAAACAERARELQRRSAPAPAPVGVDPRRVVAGVVGLLRRAVDALGRRQEPKGRNW